MKILERFESSTTQKNFSSTKELYSYAKSKIIAYAKKHNKEYGIIADTKNNIVLYEKPGTRDSVNFSDFKFPENNSNIVLMHVHPTKKASPLSVFDCFMLCSLNFEKIIAFNKKGNFSLLQKKQNSDSKKAQLFFKYNIILQENPFLPKSPLKRWLAVNIGNGIKYYEKWIKYFLEQPNINFRYKSTM